MLKNRSYRYGSSGRWSGVALLALALAGCGSDWEVPAAKRVFNRAPQVPEVPAADETIRGEDDPPIVTLKVGGGLHERQLGRVDSLPDNVRVPLTNLQNVPVTAALEAVLAGTDISLSYQGKELNDRLVTLLNLSGPLPKVVQRICSAARIFCVAREGNLELKEEQSFVIELPPIERATTKSTGGATANSIVDAISRLAGNKAEADEAGGNLIYTTTVEGQERVSKYLEQLRNGRPLVVVQMYIWEVSLDSEASRGINWKDLKISNFGGNTESIGLTASEALSSVTGGVSLGAVLSGKVSATVVANFLSTQGVVQTLSNPQLTFVSGSSAEFRVGGTRSYVSSVGQLTNSVAGTTTGGTGVGSNTVSTDKIETGLKINVNGSYESGVIFSTLAIAITDLIKIDSVSTGSTTLQLPETTNRDFSTVLRMRPGDNVLLAGMTTSRDDLARDRFNVPVLDGVPLRSANTAQNRELVVLLKPSLVFFSDDAGAAPVAAASPAQAEAPTPSAVPAPHVSAPAAVMPRVAQTRAILVDKAYMQSELGRIFSGMGLP